MRGQVLQAAQDFLQINNNPPTVIQVWTVRFSDKFGLVLSHPKSDQNISCIVHACRRLFLTSWRKLLKSFLIRGRVFWKIK